MNITENGLMPRIAKGLLIGVSICLTLILIFAFVLKFTYLNQNWIILINGAIKTIAVFFACAASTGKEKGIVTGALTGAMLIAVTYILFGLISGSLSFGLGTIIELLFGAILGAISGTLFVNIKK